MNNNFDLEIIQQTAFQEMMVDGLTEIFVALMLIFSSLIFLNPIFVIFVPLIIIFNLPVTEYVQNRVTYPQLGRVELKVDLGEKSVRRSIIEFGLLLFTAIILTLIALIIFNGDPFNVYDWARWVPMLFGVIMFGPSLYLVENTGFRRYYLFGVLATLSGFAISLLSFDDIYFRLIIYFQVMGISILILGITRLLFFIKKYLVLEVEEE
ncbi:MAG: hypothetical protein HeimC3_28420 [Candidatus Heimdallarchaeota archaeon LC_3]|nr:MAG: hypothetical protein HeimC3_28420 [Candidatus Heimdallarchaeota archaeon LC_3]